MRKTIFTIGLLLVFAVGFAQQRMYINKHNTSITELDIDEIDSITFSDDASLFYVHKTDNTTETESIAETDSLTFNVSAIYITYSGTTASVINPMADKGVTITVSGADVTANSTLTDTEITYIVSGTTSDGMLKIYSAYRSTILLNGANITNADGAAINIQSEKRTTIYTSSGTSNVLADGTSYATTTEDMKGTIFSEGQLIFAGQGSLSISGNYKHAIASDDYVYISSGNITIGNAVKDGIHANDYVQIDNGKLDITSTGDAIECEGGYILINGGDIDIKTASDGFKTSYAGTDTSILPTITVNDGDIYIYATAAAQKCINSIGNVTINGGEIELHNAGATVVTSGDPSYPTGIKSDADITINGGNITHTGTTAATGCKSISCNGNMYINGGTLNLTLAGAGASYTNTSNTADSYTASALKCDGNMVILGGNITTASSGSGGKGINVGGTLTIGDTSNCPTINVKTTGAKFSVSSSSTGNNFGPGGGGPGGGGFGGESGSYANPKAIKSEGNMVINNGIFTISTSQDGGEGIESKNILTINGGTLNISTYDDGINASSSLVINGGYIYSYASNNDGIDSNGTITITGGVIIGAGTSSPEEGFDCDQNTFKITGGIMIGIGGATSTPTQSQCTQGYITSSSTTLTSGKYLKLADANGNEILSYKLPRSISGGTVLMSAPAVTRNSSYKLYYGGTYSGGTEIFSGYTTGGTYTGTTSKSVTAK